MNLSTKLIGSLLLGVLGIVSLSQGWQFYRQQGAFQQLTTLSARSIADREWQNAENSFLSARHAVNGSLERGEMEKFSQLLQAQNQIKGLLEFSLFNAQGKITHSSVPALINRPLPPEVKNQLLTHPDKLKRRTLEAFELFQPQIVRADCIRCHLDWKEGAIGGVLSYRLSADSANQLERHLATSLAANRKANLWSAAVAILALVLVFVVLAFLTVRRLIVRPMAAVMSHLTASSDKINAMSSQVFSSSQSLAEGASDQAASLEETSSSLEEMSSMTRRNAETAGKVKELGSEARKAGDVGVTDMTALVEAMDTIKRSSTDIAKIIKTIDEIAFQTNILALNAAVEAARAGEAGSLSPKQAACGQKLLRKYRKQLPAALFTLAVGREVYDGTTPARWLNDKYGHGRGDTYQNGVRPGPRKLEQFREVLELAGTPALYAQEAKGDDAIVHVKLFDPCGSWTWYLTEFSPVAPDGVPNLGFGLVDGHEAELGYINLAELAEVRGRMGIGLEIDMHFQPCPLREVRAELDRQAEAAAELSAA